MCSGRVAKEAAICRSRSCEAILKGLKVHMGKQGRTRTNWSLVFVQGETVDDRICEGQEKCFELPSVMHRKQGNSDIFDATAA